MNPNDDDFVVDILDTSNVRKDSLYYYVTLFEGESNGRHLKREVFKLGLAEFLAGFIIFVISCYEDGNFSEIYTMFYLQVMGATVLSYQYLFCIPAFFLGIGSLLMIFYWAKVTSSVNFFIKLITVYLFATIMIFIFSLLSTISISMTIPKSKALNLYLDSSVPTCIILTITVQVLVHIKLFFGVLNLSYYKERVELQGGISEPGSTPLEEAIENDLEHMTICELFLYILAAPLALCLHMKDTCSCVLLWCHEKVNIAGDVLADIETPTPVVIMCIMLSRFLSSFSLSSRSRSSVHNYSDHSQAAMQNQTPPVGEQQRHRKRDVEEEQSKRALEENDKKYSDEDDEDVDILSDDESVAEAEATATPTPAEPEVRQPGTELLGRGGSTHLPTSAKDDRIPLTAAQYRQIWQQLPSSGAFQCKVKEAPTKSALTAHFRAQGFHVAFATIQNTNDIEVGVCNYKDTTDDPSFLARFMFTHASLMFSSVVKAQKPDLVAVYVKKFALAKVLKIVS